MPRIRLPFLIALGAAVIAAAVLLLTHHDSSGQRLAAYNRATAELASQQKLPAGFTHARDCVGICGDSSLNTAEVVARVRASIADARPYLASASCAQALERPGCPIDFTGRFHGYQEIAIIFARMLPLGTTHPPTGAVAVGRGPHKAYFSGSQVTYELVAPKGVSG